MAKDPVCGMQEDEKKASVRVSTVYKGRIHHFCAMACKATFDKNPERYIGNTVAYMTVGH